MRTPEDTPPPGSELLRFGTIAEVDLAAARCTVRVGDVLTGPIRWSEARAGDTRSWSPPTIGEQVLLLCPEGELEAGLALRGVSSTAYPPAGNSLRELIEFADGAQLAYDPQTHVLDAILPDGATVTVVARGGVTIDASEGGLAIKGDIAVEGDMTVSGDVIGKDISLARHQHGGIAQGSNLTLAPQ